MVQYKRENLIPDIIADKKLNIVVDKAINTNKRQNTIADKKLNTIADKAIDADKKQDVVASKQLNITVEPSMLIKD